MFKTLIKSSLVRRVANQSHSCPRSVISSRTLTTTTEDDVEDVTKPAFSAYYRTKESNAAKHDQSHLGRLYTVKLEDFEFVGFRLEEDGKQTLFPKDFYDRNQILMEQTLMVRRPALEIFQYLRQVDWQEQNNLRFVLWGKPGCGKSVTLSHVAHFALASNYIVLNFHKFKEWFTNYREAVPSEHTKGQYDFPVEALATLREFYHHNKDKMEGMKAHNLYKWSLKETTPEGTPLAEMVKFGIDRPRFSADCLNVLMKELKLNCQNGLCKHPVMTILDGINTIFEERTGVSKVLPRRPPSKKLRNEYIEQSCTPDELSAVVALKKLIKDDWPNSCLVTTADRSHSLALGHRDPSGPRHIWWRRKQVNMRPDTKLDTPFAVLGDVGWHHLDPFVPIEVPAFNPGELDTMIDFYVDKRYIKEAGSTDMGRREIHFISGRNPRDFMNFSSLW